MWTRTAIDAKMEEIQVGEYFLLPQFSEFMVGKYLLAGNDSESR